VQDTFAKGGRIDSFIASPADRTAAKSDDRCRSLRSLRISACSVPSFIHRSESLRSCHLPRVGIERRLKVGGPFAPVRPDLSRRVLTF